jgi:hypothetical protein
VLLRESVQRRSAAGEIRADLAERLAKSGARILLVRGELEYKPNAPFVNGTARIHAIFVDQASGQVIARAFVESGAEESGWGCSTHASSPAE